MRKVRGFTLIELMIVVAIIGVLASVAIPSFVKYVRRSKTSEALMNLRKMYDGAVAYYVGEHADSNMQILDRQFPANSGPTPTLAQITARGGGKYQTSPTEWKTGGWVALDFNETDPQYFSYTFTSSGLATDAKAAMIANGDLNGNGVYSWFERDCFGTHDGVVQAGSGVYSLNEVE